MRQRKQGRIQILFPAKRNVNILHCFKYKPYFYTGDVQNDSDRLDFQKKKK